MERAVLITALVIYLFTSVRWYRSPHDEDDLGKLMFARVSDRRTVEIWRKGLYFDVRIFDRN